MKSFDKSREGVVVFHPFYQQAESLLFGIKSLFKNQYFNVWSQIEQVWVFCQFKWDHLEGKGLKSCSIKRSERFPSSCEILAHFAIHNWSQDRYTAQCLFIFCSSFETASALKADAVSNNEQIFVKYKSVLRYTEISQRIQKCEINRGKHETWRASDREMILSLLSVKW